MSFYEGTWECWKCNRTYLGEHDLCAYKEIGSDVSHDVCTDCYFELQDARDWEMT